MKNKKGFTLVELVATMVILGVILMIAVPSYNSYIEKTKIKKCESDLRAIKDASETYVTQLIYKNQAIENAVTIQSLISDGYLSDGYSKYIGMSVDIERADTDGDGITDYDFKIAEEGATTSYAEFYNMCK